MTGHIPCSLHPVVPVTKSLTLIGRQHMPARLGAVLTSLQLDAKGLQLTDINFLQGMLHLDILVMRSRQCLPNTLQDSTPLSPLPT